VAKLVTAIRLVIVALLFAPLVVGAAGLGRLQVLSALGQPLRAEIEIVSLQAGEDDSLQARLATMDAFRQAGIEMSSALLDLTFTIDRRGARPVIRMTTFQPVNDPYLDLLIELSWSTGRRVREYTFLLDPVEFKSPSPAARPAAPAPAAQPVPAAPAPRTQRPAPAMADAGAEKQHEVKKGDTLGAIARQNLPPGVTLNQMLIALFRANRAAFIRDNVNLVRAGRILNIPDRETIIAIGAADASQQVHAHMVDFAEYKRRLGQAVAAAPAAPVREREVAGRITSKPPAPTSTDPKDQLKLSKADPAKPGAPAAKAGRDDDRVARERSLKDAQSRVSDLEKNVADLQKLVEMKNQQMADLEKKAAAKPPAPPPPPAAKAPEPAVKAPEPAAKAPEPPAKAPEPAAKAPEPEAKAPEAAAKAPEAATKAPEPVKEPAKDSAKVAAKDPAKKKAPTKAPPPEASIVDEVTSFLSDPVSGGGLAAVVVLLLGYGAWQWRRKKATQSSKFQDSVLGAATGAGAASVFGNAPHEASANIPQPAAAGMAPSEASVSGASVGGGESDEVDPIAEADVYMAYGRDAQAEEILKESLGKDSSRVAVHAKLLEIYANRKDAKSFEQTALKLKGLTGGSGPEWDKAMALGHGIDPGNGLYGSGGASGESAVGSSASAAPALDFDIGGSTGAVATQPAAPGMDFDIGSSTMAGPKSDFAAGGTLKLDSGETRAASSGLDFNLDTPGGAEDDGEKTIMMPRKAVPAPQPAAKVDPDATVAMDFDLNIDLGSSPESAKPAAEAPLDLGGLSFDLGTPTGGGGGGDPKWQEVATKLDLAKAYQEMGDKDGARELLNEVVKDGDAAQKSQAEQMLSGLG